MFSPLERFIALRYMRAKRKDGFISVISTVSLLGICLGVATLIVVMSVMNGFHKELLSRILGMNGHIVVYHQDGAIKDFDYLIEKMNANKVVKASVSGIVPVAEGQIMASSGGRSSGAMLRGIRISDLENKTGVGAKIYGNQLKDVKDNEIILGVNLARTLRATLNDPITLTSAKGHATAFGMMPRIQSYPVVSTFFMGMYEYDSGYIFMPLKTAQNYLNIQDSVTHIDLFLKDPEKTDEVKKALSEVLPNSFVVRDWRDLNSGFVGALQVEKNVMFLILMLIIIVAAFNIVSSLVMLVKDKSKDIAIMRTIGLSKRSMMKVFVLSGTLLGLIGALIGTALGVLIATYIEPIRQFVQMLTGRDLFPAEMYYLSQLPSIIDFWQVAGICFVAILLSFLATIYPAYRAAKLDPVEVLRYE